MISAGMPDERLEPLAKIDLPRTAGEKDVSGHFHFPKHHAIHDGNGAGKAGLPRRPFAP